MSLRLLMVLFGVVLVLPGQGPPTPMNIVLLVSDDHRHDSLSVAGNRTVHTPHLDRLAGDGVRFTDAYVTTSICMTSRASLLTGQYMSRHGIDQFGKPLTPGQFAASYAGIVRQAGYWTGFVGKYGVGPVRDGDFDVVRAYEGRHWYDVDGERLHVTERNARDALAFLKDRPAGRPFLLSVSFFAPHAEDAAPEQYLPQPWSADRYEGVTVPRPETMTERDLEALPHFLQQPANEGRIRFNLRFDTPERYQRSMIAYYRLVTEVDQAIGRVIQGLRDQHVYDDTLILFVGDNGYFHGERMLADKWYPYEEAIRVPLLIHDPRLPSSQRGSTRDVMALNIDVAPTIVAAAGVAVPAAMQGHDLSPTYLSTTPVPWRDEFFYEHPTITSRERIPSSQAVVRRDLKYVHWPEWDEEQLFDLRADPGERHNLAGDAAHAGTHARMRQRLTAWRDRVR